MCATCGCGKPDEKKEEKETCEGCGKPTDECTCEEEK